MLEVQRSEAVLSNDIPVTSAHHNRYMPGKKRILSDLSRHVV
jgi:hypothetical protein